MNATTRTLSELARLVDGRVVGDDRVEIRRVASIEDAGPGDVTFVAHARYRAYLQTSKASAVIVGRNIPLPDVAEGKGFLVVARPYVAFAMILQLFAPALVRDGQVSPQAAVDSTAVLGEGVTVFPHVYIGREVRVGRGSVLFPGVFLGDRVQLGEDCVLHAHVSVREGCRIGDRVVLHDGVVIGSDGFGYAGEGRDRLKVPQVGIVEIGDDVEIGANTTVDRATLGRTVIGHGTKIDNLVQIGHNVVVGENSIIAAQTGVAGSTRIGRDVIIAGQSGVGDHLEIGDRAIIGPKSGVAQSVPPRAIMTGTLLVMPHRQWLRVMSMIPRLPELWQAVRSLERKLVQRSRRGQKGV